MSSVSGPRPNRSHKEDREQALVEAAFNQIAERGFEGLRTRELALRSARDESLARIMAEAFQAWQRTLRGLLARAARDGYLAPDLDSDDVAALIMATLTSITLPSTASADRSDRAFRQLERWL